MTFDERVRALEHLGFNEPQTRFIVTVGLHSGFCLRRHYATLTGLKYGAGVRGFLDRLVARGLARRHDFRRDRGHVYHLHHASFYNSIGQDDNRNRRHTSPALIARKLMLLELPTRPSGNRVDLDRTGQGRLIHNAVRCAPIQVASARLPR